jgi:hypothetical protein
MNTISACIVKTDGKQVVDKVPINQDLLVVEILN